MSAPPAKSPHVLRVATLNLWGWFGDWPARLKLLTELWPQVDAEVLLVQEARLGAAGDQALQVADALRFAHRAEAVGHSDSLGEEGIAILSHRPLRNSRAQELPSSAPRRMVLSATVDLHGTDLRVAVSHTVFSPEQARDEQIRSLCSLPFDPLVVGGDLNSIPELVAPHAHAHGLTDPLSADQTTWPVCEQQFVRAWTEHNGGRPPYFPLAPRRLDYLLHRGVDVVRAGAAALGSAEHGFVSDHALVWADYQRLDAP